MLGNGRVEAMCFDGEKRLAHIRGKMRKKVRGRLHYSVAQGGRGSRESIEVDSEVEGGSGACAEARRRREGMVVGPPSWSGRCWFDSVRQALLAGRKGVQVAGVVRGEP